MFDIKPDITDIANNVLREPLTRPNFEGVTASDFVETFVDKWFYRREEFAPVVTKCASGSFLFILHASLSETNMSVAELCDLVTSHSMYKNIDGQLKQANSSRQMESKEIRAILYASARVHQIFQQRDKDSFASLIGDFILRFSREIEPILSDTVLMDVFSNVIALHTPKHIFIDVVKIGHQSGYIQSLGVPIYLEEFEDLDDNMATEHIERFLYATERSGPIRIAPFSKKMRSEHRTTESIAEPINLPEEMFVREQKNYLNFLSIEGFLRKIVSAHPDQLVRPKGIDPSSLSLSDRELDFDSQEIRIFKDSSFTSLEGTDFLIRGDQQYLFIFSHILHCADPLTILDERKPAWFAPITLPQCLSASMANLGACSKNFKRSEAPVFVDPFCGTGSILIDLYLRNPDAIVIGLDRNSLAFDMLRDNLTFYMSDQGSIGQAVANYSAICKRLRESSYVLKLPENGHLQKDPNTSNAFDAQICQYADIDAFEAIFKLILSTTDRGRRVFNIKSERDAAIGSAVRAGVEHIQGFHFTREMLREFKFEDLGVWHRHLFYSIWRALCSSELDDQDDIMSLKDIVLSEFERDLSDLRVFQEVWGDPQINDRILSDPNIRLRCQNWHARSFFSKEIYKKALNASFKIEAAQIHQIVGQTDPNRAQAGIFVCNVHDSSAELARLGEHVDAIVCDPPYGFNIDEGELFDMFNRLIPAMLCSLKSGGRLVCALPKRAKNGRRVPYFLTGEYFKLTLDQKARDCGVMLKESLSNGSLAAVSRQTGQYWRSASALDRDILDLTIFRMK